MRIPSHALPLLLALGVGFFLARAALPVAVAGLGMGALVVGTVMEPLVGAVAGLFLGLLRAYLQSEVPQVPAQIGHLFIALALAAHWARGLLRRYFPLPLTQGHPAFPLLLPLLAFLGVAGVSLWSGTGPFLTSGLPELVKWAEMGLLLWLVAERTGRRRLPYLVAGVVAVGAFQAAVGLYQFALRGEGPESFLIPGTDFYRAYGTFEQPNPYAGAVGMMLALTVGVLGVKFLEWVGQRGKGPTRREWGNVTVLMGMGALMAAALIASWSRGAWIGFAAALAAMALALPQRARRGFLLAGVLLVLFLALYAAGLLPARVMARLTDFAADLRIQDVRGVGINDANYAVIERLAHWQSALEMWRYHFWIGVGLGGYEPAYPRFALINWPLALGHAHNIYLNLLAETGLIGLTVYWLFWGVVFWQTWRATRRASGLARGVAVGLLGAWTHLSVHQLFDNLYVNNVHILIGLMLGLLAALRNMPTSGRATGKEEGAGAGTSPAPATGGDKPRPYSSTQTPFSRITCAYQRPLSLMYRFWVS